MLGYPTSYQAVPSVALLPYCSFRLPKAAALDASRLPPASFSQLVEQLQACVDWRNEELRKLGALCVQMLVVQLASRLECPYFCWQQH